jgi:hypothetical protein
MFPMHEITIYSLLFMQYFNGSRNKYKNYVLQNLSFEHIILTFYYKIVKYIFC